MLHWSSKTEQPCRLSEKLIKHNITSGRTSSTTKATQQNSHSLPYSVTGRASKRPQCQLHPHDTVQTGCLPHTGPHEVRPDEQKVLVAWWREQPALSESSLAADTAQCTDTHTHTHASLIISMGGNRPLLLRVFTDALLRTECKLLSWSTGENTKTSAQRLSQYTLVTEDILLTRSNGWNMGFQHSIFRDTLYRLLMRFTGVNMPLMWFQHSIFRDTLLADCWWDSQV